MDPTFAIFPKHSDTEYLKAGTTSANWGGSMNWYYTRNDEAVGPIPEEVLHRLAARGGITPETLVQREGMDTWIAYREVAPKVLSGEEQLETVPPILRPICATAVGANRPRHDCR